MLYDFRYSWIRQQCFVMCSLSLFNGTQCQLCIPRSGLHRMSLVAAISSSHMDLNVSGLLWLVASFEGFIFGKALKSDRLPWLAWFSLVFLLANFLQSYDKYITRSLWSSEIPEFEIPTTILLYPQPSSYRWSPGFGSSPDACRTILQSCVPKPLEPGDTVRPINNLS